MAQKAVDVIVEKIQTKKYETKEIYEFPLQLIVRASTIGSKLHQREA